MSSEGYIEHVKGARKRKVVLKTKILTIRSGQTDVPIFIFEGKTDVGPYEAWIARINGGFVYKGLPGDGKGQILEFWESVKESDDENFRSLYFFVDRDYDGLRGSEPSDNIFCLDSYSFENYLVTDIVLESILNDEFECAAELEVFDIVKSLYRKVASDFCDAMSEANLRLYVAARYNLERGRIENRVNQFVTISIDSVTRKYDTAEIQVLIPLLTEIRVDQVIAVKEGFASIGEPMKAHRGKYIFSFFLAWIDLLVAARKSGTYPFSKKEDIKYNRASMTFRALAGRSPIPNGLCDFILKIKAMETAK